VNINLLKRGLIALGLTGLMLVGTPQAQAFTADGGGTGSIPGCSLEALDVQRTLNMVGVVETVAAASESIDMPSSVNALTCYDQSVLMSAKAGEIFSDKVASNLPGFNGSIALGLGSTIGGPFGDGTTGTLLQDLGRVVDPVLDEMLGNFVGSLTSAIGSTLSSGFSQVAGSLLSGVPGLGDVLSGLMGQQYDCSMMQDVLDNQVYGQAPNREFSNVSLRDLINRNIPSNWGTDAMAKVLSNAGVLDEAQSVYENLNIPGFYEFNPLMPILSPNSDVETILNAGAGGGN
jgi:hypothetical protein